MAYKRKYQCITKCSDITALVGVSLLAIAVYQPTIELTDTPLSRAGSLLQNSRSIRRGTR
ncbi:hypothetical protein C1894_05485 [Pseudomonas sp. FW305-3-2-15-E-TSA2]|nr:hypothetical protein C1895_08105 [Pseudomonas sp. FW305-3-2-15-E-TSA4]POA44229.1 hypothetical protein C1894_05485 [Pseudomonas sp. FW305-3-2-15-E-TSA2]